MPGGCYRPSEFVLPDPFDYHGGKSCRNVEWDPDEDPEISVVSGDTVGEKTSSGRTQTADCKMTDNGSRPM